MGRLKWAGCKIKMGGASRPETTSFGDAVAHRSHYQAFQIGPTSPVEVQGFRVQGFRVQGFRVQGFRV